jgi:hypothetical protein
MTTVYQLTVTEELMDDPVAFHTFVVGELRRLGWFVLKTEASAMGAEMAVKSYESLGGKGAA